MKKLLKSWSMSDVKDKENSNPNLVAEASLVPLPIRCSFTAHDSSSSGSSVLTKGEVSCAPENRAVLAGCGLIVHKDPAGLLTIVGALSDGAAYGREEIQPGDQLLSVNGVSMDGVSRETIDATGGRVTHVMYSASAGAGAAGGSASGGGGADATASDSKPSSDKEVQTTETVSRRRPRSASSGITLLLQRATDQSKYEVHFSLDSLAGWNHEMQGELLYWPGSALPVRWVKKTRIVRLKLFDILVLRAEDVSEGREMHVGWSQL